MPKFSKKDYNFVAKRIREVFPFDTPAELMQSPVANVKPGIERTILANLALSFAKAYKKDNPEFDPLQFLDACSPDAYTYPLSELWNEED